MLCKLSASLDWSGSTLRHLFHADIIHTCSCSSIRAHAMAPSMFLGQLRLSSHTAEGDSPFWSLLLPVHGRGFHD